MSNEDYIAEAVKAGIDAFLKSDDEGKDKAESEKKDDIKELPENEIPSTETPEVETPRDVPEEGDLAKKYLGKDLKSASDDEITTLLSSVVSALGF